MKLKGKKLTAKTELKTLRKLLKVVFKSEEIQLMLSMKDSYKKVFRSKANALPKLNRMLDVLMVSTAYLERMTAIKNDLIALDKKSKTLFLQLKREICNIEGFKELKKKEQDVIILTEIGEFKDFIDLIDSKLKIIDNSIGFLDKLQFSVKTAVSAYKEVYNKEQT